MIIKCHNFGVELEFSDCRKPGYFGVALRSPNMSAMTDVYMLDDRGDGLPAYFAELAENWRGFDGVKTWSSLETDLELSCESDSIGHFQMLAVVRDNIAMECRNKLVIDSGQLQAIAREVERFFQSIEPR